MFELDFQSILKEFEKDIYYNVDFEFSGSLDVLEGNRYAIRPPRDKSGTMNLIHTPRDRTPILPPTKLQLDDELSSISSLTVGHKTQIKTTKASCFGTPSFRSYSVKLQKPCPPMSSYHISVYKKVRLLTSLCSPWERDNINKAYYRMLKLIKFTG